jgi:hypothetical protein
MTKRNEWRFFGQLNNCKLYSSKCLLKTIRLDTNAPEQATRRFPRVEVMSLPTIASNLCYVSEFSQLPRRHVR